jgi:hypothetical protein
LKAHPGLSSPERRASNQGTPQASDYC